MVKIVAGDINLKMPGPIVNIDETLIYVVSPRSATLSIRGAWAVGVIT